MSYKSLQHETEIPGNSKPMSKYFKMLRRDFSKNKAIYLLISIGLVYYLVFHYGTMFGTVIAFQDYNPGLGFFRSRWVGLSNFSNFFGDIYFGRVLKNTILINVYTLVWGFPIPIILALLLNEIKSNPFKRMIQTVTYIPHFISVVVVAGLIIDFSVKAGLFNTIIGFFGGRKVNLLMEAGLFRTIFVSSGIWQTAGWSSIIYIAALTNISLELYEAATIDGANRWKQALHITLPGIMPTIVIMLILSIGRLMIVNFEKIILLYNPLTYETGDVISSYVYRKGILEADFSYASAVGIFNSIINLGLLVLANTISRKVNETSLW